MRLKAKHGSGRVVSASGSETSVWSSTPTSAIIYDAYTSIKEKKIRKVNTGLNIENAGEIQYKQVI